MIIYFPLGKWDTQKGEILEIKKKWLLEKKEKMVWNKKIKSIAQKDHKNKERWKLILEIGKKYRRKQEEEFNFLLNNRFQFLNNERCESWNIHTTKESFF